jgi:hypothetical protein
VIVTCRLEFQALAGASRAERFLSCSSLTNATLVGWHTLVFSPALRNPILKAECI